MSAYSVSFWLAWTVAAVVLALLLTGAAIAVGQLVYRGFELDLPPIRDKRDDTDSWLVDVEDAKDHAHKEG